MQNGGPGREEILRSLELVLASPAFRNSKQCQKFLRHVVEHSSTGHDEMLRERTIGVEVFGRAPDYDTAADPVVRVRATEIRKRLAQYYQESGGGDPVRIEIPSGSYRVEFHKMPARPPVSELPQVSKPQPTLWRAVAVLVLATAVVAVVLVLRRPVPQTAVDQFWAPVLDSPQPVMIYCGQPVVYFLSREVHEKHRDKLTAEQQRGAYVVNLSPDETLRGRDVVPVTDQFVGIGNAHTAALLSSLFATRGKPVEIRYANDISFSDLRNSPAVLIGAFSNLWTLEMTSELRFVFEQDGGIRRIRDRAREDRAWQLHELAPDGKTPEDYAIVSRVFNSASGRLVISAAGITQYGTRAAGEFLTDPARLTAALSKAPQDWPKKNLQVLLQTTVFKGTPGPPRVLEMHFW